MIGRACKSQECAEWERWHDGDEDFETSRPAPCACRAGTALVGLPLAESQPIRLRIFKIQQKTIESQSAKDSHADRGAENLGRLLVWEDAGVSESGGRLTRACNAALGAKKQLLPVMTAVAHICTTMPRGPNLPQIHNYNW